MVPLVAIVLACGAGPALAQFSGQEGQGQVSQAYRGLFGGDNGAAGRRQGADLNGSLFGGYDDNVLAGQGGIGGGPTESGFQESGPLMGGNLSLTYFRNTGRSSLSLNTGTGLRYYPTLDDPSAPTAWAGAGWTVSFNPRTQLSVLGGFRYYPYYDYTLLPTVSSTLPQAESGALSERAEPVTDPGDLAVVDRQLYQWYAGTTVSRRLSARSTLTADYNYSQTSFTDADEGDSTYNRVGARYRYALTRDLDVRAGYYFSRRLYTGAEPYDMHDIDAGVDYNRTFQIGTQRTNLRFSVGSTMFTRQRVDEGEGQGQSFYATAIGGARFYHRFSPAWFTTASYTRGIRFIEGFAEPALQDTVVAQAAGQLNRRANLVFTAAYGTGALKLDTRNYSTASASARFQWGLWRNLAAYAQYFYYYYDYAEDVVLPAGYPPQQERQGVRAGLNFWIPLMR